MTQSIGDVLKAKRSGLDEIDIRHWVERYLFSLFCGEVRCSEVDSGRVVLVVKSSTLRQEIKLLTNELRQEALAQTGYKINDVVIYRFGG